MCWALVGFDEAALEGFQSLAFGFGVDEEDDEELDDGHDGEEDEGRGLTDLPGHDGEGHGDGGVHKPVAG